jgi:hypothetical protein
LDVYRSFLSERYLSGVMAGILDSPSAYLGFLILVYSCLHGWTVVDMLYIVWALYSSIALEQPRDNAF